MAWMVEGRQRDQWMHTARILSMMANVNRDPKRSKEYTWQDFYPFPVNKADRSDIPKVGISVLKDVFVDRKVKVYPHG